MRTALLNIYWKMQQVIAPRLEYSQVLYERILQPYVRTNTDWLDLGCGHQILPAWREEQEASLVNKCHRIVGLDYDISSLKSHRSIRWKVRGDINKIPFKDNSFDLVTANMVVEHLSAPELQFREVNRILKPGGTFLFHTPNAYGYPSLMTRLTPDKLKNKMIYLLDGRRDEDIFETHYKANTRKKIIGLAKGSGFNTQQTQFISSDAVFSVIPPLALPELILIRVLMTNAFESFRTNIIVILEKEHEAG